MPFTNVGMYQVITRWSLYLLTFLLPVFFLPFTSNYLEINKQTVLVLLTLVGLVAWLGAMVIEKRLSFRTGWLNVVPGVWFLIVLASSILSLSGYQSWVGQASQEYTSFLTLTTFLVLFFVVMNTMSETSTQRNLFFATVLSSVLSGIITILSFIGIGILPFSFAKFSGFNLVGTMNSFVAYMVVVMILGLGLWLVTRPGKDAIMPDGGRGKTMRILMIVQVILTILALVAIDYWVMWIVTIFGILLLSAFAFIQQKDFPGTTRFSLPLFLLVVSVLFLFVPSPLRWDFPAVVSPSFGASLSIAKETLGRNIGSILVGSGPGTYAFDYAEFKDTAVSQTDFWNTNFDRAKSHALTILTTMGVLGLVGWLAFVAWVALMALSRLLRERDHEEWRVTYVVFCAWATILLLQFLYTSNMTLSFLFWLFSGLIASQVMVRVKETDFGRSPKLGLATSFGFILVAVAVVGGLFVTGQRYASEVAFAQAVRMDRSGASAEEVVNKLATATSFNQLSDVYYRNLSSALLLRVRDVYQEINATGVPATPEQTQLIQALVNASINAAARTTALEPYNVDNWSVRGMVYRELMPLVNGAEDLAAASFIRAGELEPTNPKHYTDLGRIYLVTADRASDLKSSENAELATQAVESEKKYLTLAEEAFNKAIIYKQNYAPAHYYLAAVFERQGRLDDAVARMVALRDYAPLDIGIGFQLSQLYIRQQKYSLAQAELERLVGLNSNYSNARWYLASMYEISGNSTAAIEQIQKVADLNPENEFVIERLSRLKSGQSTTTIPPPVEEGEESATEVEDGEVTVDEEVTE